MNLPTFVELTEVTGHPRFKKDLPVPMRIGERLRLAFKLTRRNGGRTEILEVNGEFRVSQVGTDAVDGASRQILAVEAVGKVPTWKAVKAPPAQGRRLGPTRFPRTPVA